MKKFLITLIVLLVIGGGIAAWFLLVPSGDKGPGRRGGGVVEVGTRDFRSLVVATGTIKPKVGARINVGARLSGRVEKLSAAIGDPVKKGDVLAEIEHKDLLAQVAQKKASLEAIRTQVEAEKRETEAKLRQIDAQINQKEVAVQLEMKKLETIKEERTVELTTEKRRLESLARQRTAEVRVSSSQIAEQSASREYASKDLNRMETLYSKGMLTEQARDKAVSELKTADSRLRSTRNQRQLAAVRLQEDTSVQEEVVRQAEARLKIDVALQEEAIKQAEANLEAARRERDAVVAASESNIRILEAGIPRIQAEIEESDIKLTYATIRSPIDGIVGSISTQEGETVAAGLNSPTFVTVVDLAMLQVDAYVDEVDIGKVSVGMPATFTVDTFPSEEFKGHVTAIYPSAIIQDNVVYYDVVVEIDTDFAGRLRPEMTANVSIEVASVAQRPALPAKAVQRKAGASFVMVAGSNGPEEKRIEVGLEDSDYIEIIEGLNPGDKVLLPMETPKKEGEGPR